MLGHLRAQLLLVVLTLLFGAILYPLAVLAFAQLVFPFQANGSLIGPDGKPARPGEAVGSRQIAQAFTGDEWFHPRPSAVSYNGAGSGGSNWGANNPRLRARVAQQLGPIVKYATGPKAGERAGPDVERWFAEEPHRVATWAKDHPALATAWVGSHELIRSFVSSWAENHPEVLEAWREASSDKEPIPAGPEELAVPFFASYARVHPGTWPAIVEIKLPNGMVEQQVQPLRKGTDIQAVFLDSWLQAHPQARLERIPADRVMTSGSGLDPHITLRNARSQLDRVIAAQAARTKASSSQVRSATESILNASAFTPLGGLAGTEPLVNVLEVNLQLRATMQTLASK